MIASKKLMIDINERSNVNSKMAFIGNLNVSEKSGLIRQ